MAIRIFNHDKAAELGLKATSYGSFPDECFDISYVGAVLETYERNGYDDSDFYAIVWDEAEQCTKSIEYASTRGWTYLNSAVVDATDEVKEKAHAHRRAMLRSSLADGIRARFQRPYVGAQVTVARGRKVPRGVTGEVLTVQKQYDGYTREDWLLIFGPSGAWKVKAAHCDVMPNPAALERALASELAAFDARDFFSNWRSVPYQHMRLLGSDFMAALS